jgi:hypothetical protein
MTRANGSAERRLADCARSRARDRAGGRTSRRRRAAALAFAAAAAAAAAGAISAGREAAGRTLALSPVAVLAAAAENPTAAVDPHTGTGYVAWIEKAGSGADVYLARAALDAVGTDPVGFAPAVRVNDIAGDAAAHDQAPPQVAVGTSGEVYVVWQNNRNVPGRRFPASNLRFARSTDGGRTFEPAIHVNDDWDGPPSSHTFHDIAVSPDGAIHVSWIDGRERTRAEPGHAGHDAHHGGELPGPDLRVATSVDGGSSFGPGVVVHRGTCPCCRTAVAAGADGLVLVAFRAADHDIRNILVARSTDGGATFAEPVPLHDDGWRIAGCPHAGPSLALDAAGRLHAAWYTGAPERQGLWHTWSADGGRSFAPPTALQAGEWVPVSQVKLAATQEGGVAAVWEDRRGEERRVLLAALPGAGTGRAAPRQDRSVPGVHPAIAAADGTILVAWVHDGAVVAAVTHPPAPRRVRMP